MAARKAAPKRATVEDLLAKVRRSKELQLGEGDTALTLVFQAMGSKAYDDLIAAHPPTKEQKAQDAAWNPDTFAPALIAGCSVEPKIDDDTAVSIWASDSWSRGELMDLFMSVVRLNSEGLNIPFTSGD